MDGQSFAAELIDQSNTNQNLGKGRQILIEYWGEGNDNTYAPDCTWSQHDRLAVRHFNKESIFFSVVNLKRFKFV